MIFYSDGGFGYIVFRVDRDFGVSFGAGSDGVIVFIADFGFVIGDELRLAVGCLHV